MRNQSDVIAMIVAAVFTAGLATGFFFTQRKPVEPVASPKVNLAPVALPDSSLVRLPS
jgi:hypothetical protein